MFRLIKLAFYSLIGYALYELARGFFDDSFAFSAGGQGRSRDLNRALNSNEGRLQTLAGEGQGMRESTFDSSGTSVSHKVGRGVVTR